MERARALKILNIASYLSVEVKTKHSSLHGAALRLRDCRCGVGVVSLWVDRTGAKMPIEI